MNNNFQVQDTKILGILGVTEFSLVATLHDITEKSAAKKVRHFNETLERRKLCDKHIAFSP